MKYRHLVTGTVLKENTQLVTVLEPFKFSTFATSLKHSQPYILLTECNYVLRVIPIPITCTDYSSTRYR
jgi:hypothetical protein